MDANQPILQFSLQTIKFPQLVGIIAGCIVFITTIGVVIYLLYASGTLSRAFSELQNPQGDEKKGKDDVLFSPYSTQPELYEHLIKARFSLSENFLIPKIEGVKVNIKLLSSADIQDLYNALNGTPQYEESSYDPARLWGWMEMPFRQRNYTQQEKILPWKSVEEFRQFIAFEEDHGKKVFIAIEDREYRKVIGFICLTDHQPLNLSLRIDSIIVTPSFQGKRRSHEALFYLLEWLFVNGYRRVTAKCDERHIIYRKFLQRCLFQLEVVLRKHRIIANRNVNDALYFMLNSDWPQLEVEFKRLLGLPIKKEVKAAEIRFSVSLLDSSVNATTSTVAPSSSSTQSQKQRKKKNKKTNQSK